MEARGDTEVLARRECLVQEGLVGEESHLAAHGLARVPDIVPEDARLAVIGPQRRGEHAQKRRLAGAVAPGEHRDGSREDLEAHVGEGPAPAVAAAEAFGLDGQCHACGSTRRGRRRSINQALQVHWAH
jgi:hypothetical protein